jgi:ABC-type transporter Mla subunit MlaD
MSRRGANRNNVLAGFFLVSSIILAVFMAFWVEDGIDKLPFVNPKRTFVARFEIGEGVAGIKPGSPVTLGGKSVGSVESIEYAYEERGGQTVPVGIDVELEIARGIVLYPDATVSIVSPLLGTLSSINISSIGGGDEPLASGGTLDGQPAAGLADMAGVGDLAREARAALAKANAILDEVSPAVSPALEDIDATLEGARSFAGMLAENQDAWSSKATGILDHADAVFVDVIPEVADGVNAGVSDARRLVSSAQGMIDENRADVRRTVTNLEGVTTRVRYDILGRVERVLDEGVIAAANLSDVGGRAVGLLDRIEPPLVRTVSNAQLTSGQAMLLLEEVRAAPWRLLEKPDEKEQREVVLFGAVRRYAQSVEKLRDASDAMDSVLRGARAGGRELRAEQVLEMNSEIKASFDRLEAAERALLELIARETGG